MKVRIYEDKSEELLAEYSDGTGEKLEPGNIIKDNFNNKLRVKRINIDIVNLIKDIYVSLE